MMRTLAEWQREAHDLATSKGFYDGKYKLNPDFLRARLMLVVTEVAEAAEALREYEDPKVTWLRPRDLKPEGFAFELADIVLRVFDLAESVGLDLESYMESKHEFNATRPHLNGKKS